MSYFMHTFTGYVLCNYGLVLEELLRQSGSRLYTYGQIHVPCLHPRSEVSYTPLARLLLALAFPLQQEGTPTLLVSWAQKAIKKLMNLSFLILLTRCFDRVTAQVGNGDTKNSSKLLERRWWCLSIVTKRRRRRSWLSCPI